MTTRLASLSDVFVRRFSSTILVIGCVFGRHSESANCLNFLAAAFPQHQAHLLISGWYFWLPGSAIIVCRSILTYQTILKFSIVLISAIRRQKLLKFRKPTKIPDFLGGLSQLAPLRGVYFSTLCFLLYWGPKVIFNFLDLPLIAFYKLTCKSLEAALYTLAKTVKLFIW